MNLIEECYWLFPDQTGQQPDEYARVVKDPLRQFSDTVFTGFYANKTIISPR